MRWLIHGTLTPAVTEAVIRHGHSVRSPADVGLTDESPLIDILKTAHAKQLDLMTNSPDLIETQFVAGKRFDRSIVYLQLAGGDVEQDDAIDRLFARYKRLSPEMLYTVTETRVKVRQLPTKRREASE